jgi:coenzyme F420-0:L-glutamate ligase
MQLISIKTRIMNPPKDDLYAMFDEYVTDIQEGDVILVSSKIVAIDEGRCVKNGDIDKDALMRDEAVFLIERDYWKSPITVVHNAFIGTSGIDESNAGGYLIFLPEDPFASAKKIHLYLRERFNIKNIGVIITDSHSQPMRYGASGISVGFWGFQPLKDCRGEIDLFGKEMKIETANIVDGLSAAATVVMGEVAECQPVVIARDVPDLIFTEENTKDKLFVPFEEDTFRVLYEKYVK